MKSQLGKYEHEVIKWWFQTLYQLWLAGAKHAFCFLNK